MHDERPIRAGVFDSESGAERAVSGLIGAGYPSESIKLVAASPLTRHPGRPHVERVPPAGDHTKGAVVLGAALGAVLGGATGALGAASLGGFEPMVVLIAALAAAAAGVVGGYVGAMLTRGLEPEIADFHDQELDPGQFLVSVEESEGGPPLSSAEAVFRRVGSKPIALARS